VAVVLAVGGVARTAAVSPLTKPVWVMVNAGLAVPGTFRWSSAFAASGALAITSVPLALP